ncbi:MAG: hypothetical protein CMB45_02910 [Euryarchaeota archaeon]|nr:hypothetical protein [Euryarchaeota archaeon]
MFIPILKLSLIMAGVKKTRTQRKAALVLPWVKEVMVVGEELTSNQIISRIKERNAPLRGRDLMLSNERRHSRNLRNLPNTSSLSSILQASNDFVRAKNTGVIVWRRVV